MSRRARDEDPVGQDVRLGGFWDRAQHDNPSPCLDISGVGGTVSKLVDVPDASAHLPVLPTPPPTPTVRYVGQIPPWIRLALPPFVRANVHVRQHHPWEEEEEKQKN